MKTIKDALNIKVVKIEEDRYVADAKVLSGSPPIGCGKTEHEALYDLLAEILFMSVAQSGKGHWEQTHRALSKFWKDLIDNKQN